MFAHSASATRAAVEATAACGLPRWAKLSPNTADLVDVAGGAEAGGAEAVTLVNTVRGMALDRTTGRSVLGHGAGGGLSGPAIHPIAVQAVHDVRSAYPDLPIIGVGGVATGPDAADLLLAGAQAVQVGTAIFAEPRAPRRVLDELAAWAGGLGVRRLADVVGATQRGGLP
jgi:dihydroorotate dehydrogenase (NAD+) catalytic subunit